MTPHRSRTIVDALLAKVDVVRLANELGKPIDAALIKAAKVHSDRNRVS